MTTSNARPAALVTGGAIRLGRAIALALAAHGFDIALHFNRSAQQARHTRAEIEALGGSCEIFQQDLAQVDQLPALIERVHAVFPALNLLVNSASGYRQATINGTTPEIFDSQFSINLRAPFFLTQAFAQICRQGNVINIIDNKIGFNQFQYAAYLLAKKSLAEFTKMAALELAPDIRVNGVAPGVVLPAQTRSQDYIDWRVQGIPLKMQGQVEHITQTVIYILENQFVTGQNFVIDGGESITNEGQNAASFGAG
jgi:NAD(P)-dependent dehydrogenase (short-subunit alcohol dehydrogenase family)